MVVNIPAKLKSLDISRFAQRATQLDKFKPIVAYWCYYWVLQQILSKQLQSADAECMAYATTLMDHVEQLKTQHASEDAVTDDVAGQAYVEQFGLETFQRADNAIRANKVSKQTADTLQAAATFLELVNIWSPPSPEAASKIKYAKFHALRIVRAIKAGEDPNLSNPPPPEAEAQAPTAQVELDPNDPEVQSINRAAAQQPRVADAPEDETAPASAVLPAETANAPAPSPGATISQPHADIHASPPPALREEPSTNQPPSNARQDSVGGGYFPEIPSAPTDEDLISPAPTTQPPPEPSPGPPQGRTDAEAFYHSKPPAATVQSPPPRVSAPSPMTAPAAQARVKAASAVAQPAPTPSPSVAFTGTADDAAMAEASKHAKWAISALNFDDVPTAVRELRAALQRLGAS